MTDSQITELIKHAGLMERCIQDFVDLQGTNPSVQQVDNAISNLIIAKGEFKNSRNNNFLPREDRLI
jgi:hypothetical protein